MMAAADALIPDYYGNKPWSLGGVNRLKSYFPQYSVNAIKKFLHKQRVFTKFNERRRSAKQQFNSVIAHHPRYQIEGDLFFINRPPFSEQNNGFKYVLVLIDCWTRYR